MDAEDRFSDSENEECKDVALIKNMSPNGTCTKKKQLVSYCDDTYEDTSSEKEEIKSTGSPEQDGEEQSRDIRVLDNDAFPEPKGTCDPKLQDKIIKMMTTMKETDCDWNTVIQNKKSLRNPSIYEKLIEFCGINEFGTNYRSDIYEPDKWGRGPFYDELNEVQKLEMEKRVEMEKLRVAELAKVVGSSPLGDQKIKVEEVTEQKDTKMGKKRKRNTKWDPTPNTLSNLPTVVKPAFSGLFQRFIFIKKP